MARTIDFAEIRRSLPVEQVLTHYGVEIRSRSGDQLMAICPFHPHKGPNGTARSPSFSVNTPTGRWHCHSCKAGGSALDLVVRLMELNPEDGKDVRKAALFAADTFLGGRAETPETPTGTRKRPQRTPAKAAPVPVTPRVEASVAEAPSRPPEPASEHPVVTNAPLDFVLQGLDPTHPYLADRGFTAVTITTFGLGYCNRGLMKGRIAIPLHNREGQLIGYAGRMVDEAMIGEGQPKYRLPGERTKNGTTYEFRKSAFLYNANALETEGRAQRTEFVVVEGFPSVWWLHQHGIRNVVATMGASLSEEQATIIRDLSDGDDRVWILSDGDPAGERMATEALQRLAASCWVRWVKLPSGKQPTDLAKAEMEQLGLPFS